MQGSVIFLPAGISTSCAKQVYAGGKSAVLSITTGAGVKKHDLALFSLHQMGSCRMGSSIQDSVTDGEGECWECSNLYIADASAFPTASGTILLFWHEAGAPPRVGETPQESPLASGCYLK